MRVMKTVSKELKRKGVTMKRYYNNFPLCCPSRTTLLTGQYAHNHGVLSNQAPDGGYGLFNELHGDNNLAVWLQEAGYATSYVGKFLNEYAEPDEYGTLPRDVPQGWDDWRVLAPSNAQYFGYTLNQNGRLTEFGEREQDYSTDVFTTKAKRFIRRSSQASKPFFLTLGYAAPHGGGGGAPGRSCNRGAVPAPRDLGTLKQKKKGALPTSFNEADVSREAEPGLRARRAHPGPDQRHAAQAPLRLGVAALGRRQRRRDRRGDQARRRAHATPTSSSSPTTATCAASTGSETRSATSTRSRPGPRSSPAGPGSPATRSSMDVVTQRRPGADDPRAGGSRSAVVLPDGESLFASLAEPEARAGPGDPARGLRRRRDHRAAQLALPVHRVGHGARPARDRALRQLHRPEPARQPGRRSRPTPASSTSSATSSTS